MSTYTITQVSDLLGIKVHTIRYWEKHIPLISIKRDDMGKRLYGKQDIFILSRMAHLIEKKRYTVRGASDEIVEQARKGWDPIVRKTYFDALKKFKDQRGILKKAHGIIDEIKNKK